MSEELWDKVEELGKENLKRSQIIGNELANENRELSLEDLVFPSNKKECLNQLCSDAGNLYDWLYEELQMKEPNFEMAVQTVKEGIQNMDELSDRLREFLKGSH
ncbi:hypothetical protein [Gottfriedia acidiceleris]|uniref:Uncharacterized protein n=1 Tax=Gottfriedia acidiceleris TaxID=371036 RepID=A0ABY4JJ93_9BACI|nr:hypothetical protein [Gottfriedia acidiceleris]UPM53542.1 hypothetical protein MY490_17360 [Gottfriedia acidiceleris]